MERKKPIKDQPLTNLQSTTIRPGLLVSLKTSVQGNIHYDRKIIEPDHMTKQGEKKARWETLRVIHDPAEWEEAVKVQTKAGSLIRGACVRSAFGLLCPEKKVRELDTAIGEAHKLTAKFNASAKLTQVHVFVISGTINPDDREAVRSINSEVRSLMAEMQEGVKGLDVKRIRQAAARAKQLGGMLPEDSAGRMQVAINAARSAAKKIVQAGETAVAEIDSKAIKLIREARTAFLDLDDAAVVKAPVQRGRAIDLVAAE